jgi:subtilisin family serine protease
MQAAQFAQVAQNNADKPAKGRNPDVNTIDAGDFYKTPSGERKLLRLAGSIAVQFTDPKDKEKIASDLIAPGGALSGYEASAESGEGVIVFKAPPAEREQHLRNPKTIADTVTAARKAAGVRTGMPVFIDPKQGLKLIPTEEIIIKLKAKIDSKAYFGAANANVRPLPGTNDQFVMTFPKATAEQILAEVNRHAANASVEWAEPNFLGEVRMHNTPNDLFYPSQWHLNNIAQGGASVDADVDAPEAWNTTTGSSNIVIALLDNGVQLNHPDLAANIFSNASETPSNNIDDDNNGYVDDIRGWDFRSGDNDPNPLAAGDNHGTATAGVAAAAGNNNSVGIAGVAFGCKVMPIRVATGDNSFVTGDVLANAIRYSAGLTTPQHWRGADVISMSFTFSQSSTLDSALNAAATQGRNGKGCPIFVLAGNNASAYRRNVHPVSTPGDYIFEWRYKKDGSLSQGQDTAWLANITFPNGLVERFDSAGPGLPAGWATSGNASWAVVDDPSRAFGTGRYEAKAGTITDDQTTTLRAPTIHVTTPGDLTYWIWTSSETFFDNLELYVSTNGGTSFSGPFYPLSGVGENIITTAVGYPASHADTIAVGASTDFDFRSDYSQYGTALDFVAPSDGGRTGIYTTDRTGSDGYSGDDYDPDFGGTSAACPLAAGIGALILSVNPALTAAQVRTFMRTTCDKIGGVTYTNGTNQFYGHGRVNAQAAVAAVVNPSNTAPTISNIIDQSTNEDVALAAVAFTVGDSETAAGSLAVTGSSSNTALVPTANISFGGSGANRTVSVTPAGDQNGSATITVTVSDGVLTASDNFVLTINAVNDPPSFTMGPDQSALNTAGPQTVANWATAISKGVPNESAQVLNFIVSNDNNPLFSAQPAIAANGTLSYTPAANADGIAMVTVRIHDDGGTVNGGIDTSTEQTFAIYVTPPGMLYVDLNYNGPNPIGSPIAPFPLVKTAVNSAVNGNTIRIYGGNYQEVFVNADVIGTGKVLFMERWEKPQIPRLNVVIGQ